MYEYECAKCGHEGEMLANFCSHCGNPLRPTAVCPVCGETEHANWLAIETCEKVAIKHRKDAINDYLKSFGPRVLTIVWIALIVFFTVPVVAAFFVQNALPFLAFLIPVVALAVLKKKAEKKYLLWYRDEAETFYAIKKNIIVVPSWPRMRG